MMVSDVERSFQPVCTCSTLTTTESGRVRLAVEKLYQEKGATVRLHLKRLACSQLELVRVWRDDCIKPPAERHGLLALALQAAWAEDVLPRS